jgi:hypothetical protein
MAAPTVAIRCPSCGQELSVVLAPSPPTQWFPCPHCRTPVPVVVPRDPPPLYSWEVLPGLYPALPRPRRPRWRARQAAAAALLAVLVLSIALAGVLGYYGMLAPTSGDYTVSGTVVEDLGGGRTAPAAGAVVVLTPEGQAPRTEYAGAQGVFNFLGVPTGGLTLNFSLPGYSPVEVDTFVSPVYDAGTQGILVTLEPGGAGSGTTVAFSAFPDLETFLASIGSGVLLLGIVAVVAGVAVVGTLRGDRPALGVVGGGAGLLAPLGLYLLALAPVFPLVLDATAALAAFGAFALALRTVEMAQTGPAPGPD